ncbi:MULTISPECIES: dimethylarginine dimethylaminohydrolase family protein [Brucella]|uniref:Dimethylarginine dimethylaminohydrolase n=1 Tax=Brucella pituitosa TaxID=571256 RepID=A0A643F143_9HYPH|nr:MULTISPECIES: arginine deiminase family protein [Brucella]PQZ48284.1 dimethylarginine dimethylaminohydrolase [Ochrobactrum sp. MYb19]PRA54546.1 dimethylarginine dimethylaminohydrolase [Ochrobactrum sp. MYb68]PRA64469.1 dimethylarginine dimethylaminohydrolase [Ochrobactrum sp. MYb18]PRA75020.1 dimethylarginine dimethylaminohydrolase [Brucella thiophenivorans]PRA89767.1 dimethylarginine dimethylaminohydrolase [Ochrobactrum sp. MYb14]PRA96799.1 dimethylarginine dimethylaminohydrolase [Ochroba
MSSNRPVYEFNSIIVREPSRSVVNGLRALDTGNPTYEGVKAEHDAYIAAMRAAGVEVTILPALEDFPDSIFVEDPALVFTEGAILLRPGALTRVGETAVIEPTLRQMFDTVVELPEPGFADGGDVLTTQKSVMIGLSARTDKAGAAALIASLDKIGRKGEVVSTPEGVLHFKTDCSLVDEETVLSTSRLAKSGVFSGLRQLIVPEGEEAAANALRVNDVVMVGSDFPRTIELLEKSGYNVVPLKTTEIGKIDAGLSCMSLRWYRK